MLECLEDDLRTDVGIFLVIDRQGCAQKAVGERTVADVDGGSVPVGALAALGMEELVIPGQIDDSHLHLVQMLQAYADTAVVHPAAEICRSVDGVDDPGVLVAGVPLVLFLTEETATRQCFGQTLAEKFLDGYIGRGDDVCVTILLFNLEVLLLHLLCGFSNYGYQFFYCHSIDY